MAQKTDCVVMVITPTSSGPVSLATSPTAAAIAADPKGIDWKTVGYLDPTQRPRLYVLLSWCYLVLTRNQYCCFQINIVVPFFHRLISLVSVRYVIVFIQFILKYISDMHVSLRDSPDSPCSEKYNCTKKAGMYL